MAYLEDLIQTSLQQAGQSMYVNQSWVGLPQGAAYSSFYPEWEVTSPQYVTPNPYSLAQMGYRTNEIVFTAINVRADSVSEAPLTVWDTGDDTPEEIRHHAISELLVNPCPGVSEQVFWKIIETYLGIAGFSAWEKQRNNRGEVIRLWPMRPDWCSFLRGQQKPVRAIRYQPYGLPYLDIAIEDVLLFAYFDPLYPLLKPFSPTMSALEIVDVDNNMTNMINSFIKNGAFLGGVLSTENQVLQEAEAETYKRRWRESHGGAKNAGDIAVLGKGLKFQTTSNTFRDMVFGEVDARSEARITMVFRVPPMLIGAKIGMDRSTYSNYQEARKGFYEGPITSEWKFLAGIVKDQLMADFESEPKLFTVKFDSHEVKALQEDRNSQVDRGVNMYKSRIAKLNEARKEVGLDPVEGVEGDSFYEMVSVKPQEDVNAEGEVEGSLVPPQLRDQNQPPEKTQEQQDLEDAEEKNYRTYVKHHARRGDLGDFPPFEFKYLSLERQRELIRVAMGEAVISRLNTVLENG